MTRILSLIIFCSFNLFANDYGIEGVTEQDRNLFESHHETLVNIQKALSPEDLQRLYETGELKKLLTIKTAVLTEKAGDVLDGIVDEETLKSIENNPYTQMKPDEMMRILDERSKGTQLEKIFEKLPRVKTFMAHWMIDKSAMPQFFKLLQKKKQLRNYGVFVIIILLLSIFLVGKWVEGEHRILIKFLKKYIGRLGTVWFSIFLFYLIFQKEIGPTWYLVKKFLLTKGT